MSKDDYGKLKDEYYKKLKDEGFVDIENAQGTLIDHKDIRDLNQRIGFKPDIFDHIRDYYLWAEQQNSSDQFQSAEDQAIWALHANGKSSRQISSETQVEQTRVCKRIKAIRQYLMLVSGRNG